MEKQRQVEEGYGIVGRADSLRNSEGDGCDMAIDDQEDSQSSQCIQISEPSFYFHKVITFSMIGATVLSALCRYGEEHLSLPGVVPGNRPQYRLK